jgi:hypothetical protein
MPTRSSSSTARACRAAPSSVVCSSRFSRICAPTVSTGLSALIGSWKIIAISLPRTARTSGSLMRSTSRPRHSTWPLTRPGGLTRRRMPRKVMLLPEPDSPAMPSTSPGRTSKSTPSTAINA